MSRYLVVGALRSEAVLRPAAPALVLTGIGKTAAAVATTRAQLGTDRTELTVLNVGTAGALRPEREGLFLPRRVLNHDINADVVRPGARGLAGGARRGLTGQATRCSHTLPQGR